MTRLVVTGTDTGVGKTVVSAALCALTGATYWKPVQAGLDGETDRELVALDHIPERARLLSFVGTSCRQPWSMSRLEHLPGIALVRNRAFSNEQWSMLGAQLLHTTYRAARGYAHDASQMVTPVRCRNEAWRSLDQSLRGFPRDAFDYVWLIRPPAHDPALTRGMVPIWRSGDSVVYRIVDRNPLPPESMPTP